MTESETDRALSALAKVVDGRPLSTVEVAAVRELLRYGPQIVQVARGLDALSLSTKIILRVGAMVMAVVAFWAAVGWKRPW